MIRVPHRDELLQRTISRDDVCVELGAWTGDLTLQILKHTSRVLVVDTWDNDLPYCGSIMSGADARNMFDRRIGTRAAVYCGDTAATLNSWPAKSVDWVYIDADHSYSGTLRDLMAARRVARKWICGHDFCELQDYGVVRAVAVFCDRHRVDIDMITDEPQMATLCGKQIAFNSYAIRVQQ
jgi:hypothetical protein